MSVEADKGFNFSHFDESFICQKKNHFQVTTQMLIGQSPMFLGTTSDSRLQPILSFKLDFQGVKV